MGLFENFPYTNFHELNLDIICEKIKELEKRMDTLPQEIQDEIAPQIVTWIQDYLSDAGISFDNGTLKILPTDPATPSLYQIDTIQLGDQTYKLHDDDAASAIDSLTLAGNQLRDDVDDLMASAPVGAILNYTAASFFVASSGDDDAIGDIDHPWRTLDRAFSEFERYDALWIYIEEIGNYAVHNYGIFASKSLHLTAEADGVVVTFYDPDHNVGGMPIYASHWNLRSRPYVTVPMKIQCFELDGVTPSFLYFDCTLLSCENVEFANIIRFYGGTGAFDKCTLYRVYMMSSSWTLKNGTTFTCQDETINMVWAINSMIQITGSVDTAETYHDGLAGDDVACWYFQHTDIFLGAAILQTHTHNWYRAVQATFGSRITISTTRYNQTGNHSIAGIAASDPDEGWRLEMGSTVNTYA